MDSFRRVIRKGMLPCLQKTFSFSVILSLVVQPMAAPLLLGAFVFSVPTKVVAQETEPVVEEVVVEEEETTPEETTPTEAVDPEPVEGNEASVVTPTEVAPVTPEETPGVSVPVEEEGSISQEAASTTDKTSIVEEEKTHTTVCLGSGDETKESGSGDWNTSEEGKTAETKDNVKLGVKYTFPGRADVSVTFTCLPSDESKLDKLKIEEINAEDINLPEGVVAVSEYAYDITTGMDNGDFKYDLSLPKTNTLDTEVSYIEQSAEQVLTSNITENELKNVDEGAVKEDGDSIKVHELDHFTVFLVTANATLSSSSVGTPNNGWVSDNAYAVFDGDSDWAEYGFPDIVIPVGATIDGIEVLVEGFATSDRDFEVSLWNISDGADAYTSAQTANISGSDTTQTLGGTTNLWGKTWTQADFADATFKVRVEADNDSGTASLDRIEVKVHYTASTKDLTVTKVNNVSGAAVVNSPFTWTLTVTNTGTTAVTFNNQDIVEDDLPSSNITYADTTDLMVVTAGGVTGTIDCDINSNTLDCDDNSGGSTVVIPAGGSFSVDVVATPTSSGTFSNPRNGGSNVCMVDPDALIAEFNESNNNCADTVTATEYPYTETTICHATGSNNNPYVEQSPATVGVLMGHVGNSHQNGKDIIPPVPFYLPNGQNWDVIGQAIWRNKCVAQGGLKAVKVVDDQSMLTQWSFQLDNGAPIQANSNGEVDFGQVSLGQHTVTENGPNGYSLSSVTGCTQVPTTLSATATVAAGSTTICTFSNAVNKGSVTIIKDTQPNNSQDFTFTASGNGVTGSFTLDDDGDSQNDLSNTQSFQNLFPGQYSFSEESLVGWELASLSCDNGSTSLGVKDGSTIAFALHAGEHITCTFTNTQRPGTLHIKKVIENGTLGTKHFQDFSFQVNNEDVISFDEVDGQNDVAVPADGTYTVTEVPAPGYVTSYDNCSDLTIPALGEETCTITNRINPVRIVATKVVCSDESELPNYGEGGPNITASSAADWVATHKSCSLAPDWQFQWSYDGTPHNGDNVALGGANWTTSDFTDGNGRVTMDVPNYDQSPKIWVREVYQDNFIPFTFNLPGGENNANPVSAEIYCHTDVVNYDNWDWVGNPQDGDTYYCVAWNAPKKGKIIIEKQTDPAGSERAFAFDSSWGESFELADDESVTYELMPGEYGVSEEQVADWELTEATCDDQSPVNAISLQSGETVTCVFKNQEKARIVATKIVCADEADLPNYGEVGGPNITPTTAVDWVATHESCRFQENWQFQWAYRSTNNPGDNTGASINPDWHTFGPTNVNGETSADVDLKSTSALWVREVWNEEYIPFTYGQDEGNPNSNDQSAEIYCHTDVVNYDNYDLIDTSDAQLTYNCVAWNVEQKGTIIGEKYEDINGNGVRDEEDGALAGWTLYVDLNQNGILDENEPFGVTNEQGQYVFVDLPAGESYVVEEVQQSGWEQTANTCKGDREEENNEEEVFPVLNNIQDIIFGLDERTEPLGGGQTVRCVLLNHFTDPELTIEKTNDSFPTVEVPGNTVTFTLKVKASKNKVENVTVTDLPPAGFAYVSGSATVTSTNGAHSGPLELTHVYASPGVWSLGTLEDGEEATLTYQAKISGSQDEGTYNDLAYAAGASLRGADVLATDVSDADNFAATRVAVALTEQNKVKIDEDEEEETDTKKKYVLGAALPATGATTSLLVLALALLLAGGAILLGNRKKTLVKVLVLGLLMTGGLLGGVAHAAPAPEGLAVTMEDPDAAVTTNSFKIGFVALDILNRTVEVACFSNGVQYDSYTLIPGGSSGDCQVNSTAMPVAGTYDFYVTATVDGESGGTLESNHETVNLVTGAPGKPREYDRDESTCDDKISFRTDSDGGRTVKVEVYRSKNKSFVATTPVATLAIGSDTEGTITTTPPSCHEDYWYAIRAVDADGIGSEFVGDVDVNVTTDTKTETITRPGEQAASGALPVTAGAGATTEGGAVEGAATGENANENGAEVLGEMTEDDQSGENSWMKDNKGGLFIGALLILGALYYLYARRRMATASLTDNE